MKRFVESIPILLAGLLILTQAFAAGEGEEVVHAKKARTALAKKDKALAFLGDDLEFMADPNAIKTKLKKFEGLDAALEQVDKKSRNEVKEWLSGLGTRVRIDGDTLDDRIDLVRDVQEQVIQELVFIREIAVEEGAAKTTAAIEGLLLARRQRYAKIYAQMQEAEKRIAEQRREERGTRRSEREVRDRDKERERAAYREEMAKKRRLPRRGRVEDSNSVAQ